jgi:hypothetical protein
MEKRFEKIMLNTKVNTIEPKTDGIHVTFEFEGKSYYKSKKSGIIYNMDQEVVGKWNEENNNIDFEDEETEDDYEE